MSARAACFFFGAFTLLLTANSCSSEGGEPSLDGGGSGGRSGESSGGAAGAATGGRGSTGGEGSGGAPQPNGPASLLSRTGLYTEDVEELAPGVVAFTPRFPLYSDGATKRRWLLLPEDTPIDTSDGDYWIFPVGTKLWKEFTRDGVRVETRLLEKRPDGSWWRLAYRWNEEQTDAEAVPEGEEDALGTPHDIPSTEDCDTCHGATRGTILGFSAIQLAFEGSGIDLDEWFEEGRLTHPVSGVNVPGDEQESAVLGYLHANCGTCHNPTSGVQVRVDLDLRLPLGLDDDVTSTPSYRTSVGVPISVTDGGQVPGATLRVDPGSPSTSALFLRLDTRGELYSMPPLGTELVDEAGKSQIAAWIRALPSP